MKHTFSWTKIDAKQTAGMEASTELDLLVVQRDDGLWDFNGYPFPTEQDAIDAAEAYAAWAIVRRGLSATNKAKKG